MNKARAGRRRSARHPDADRLTQREVTGPDTELTQTELRSAIDDAIAELPPGQRTVVLGKLFEGRSSVEVGREMGLQSGAVRTRLHRGLERLKAILPASLATVLFAWLTPSKGIAGMRARVLEQASRSVPASLAGASTGAIGATVASKKLLTGAAGFGTALLVALGLHEALTVPPGESSQLPKPSTDFASLSQGDASKDDTKEDGVLQERVIASRSPAPLAKPQVVVEVVGPGGAAQANELVRLNLGLGQARSSVEANTGSDGLAHFALEANTYFESIELPVQATRPRVLEFQRTHLQPSETRRLSIEALPGFSVSGLVVHEDGYPVPYAEVLAWCGTRTRGEADRRVTAGKDGSFRIEHLGPDARIMAQAKGLACRRGLTGAPEQGGNATGLQVVMAPAMEIRGGVYFPDGRPAEGVPVWVPDGMSGSRGFHRTAVNGISGYSAFSSESVTDAKGRFRLEGLASGSVRVSAKLVPFLELPQEFRVGETQARIVLDAGEEITGQVFDSKGFPAAGAQVIWGPYYSNRHHSPRKVIVDANGYFRIKGMSFNKNDWGPPWLGVSHEGHAIQLIQPIELGSVLPDIQLDPGYRISGVVVDQDGKPQPAFSVQLRGGRPYKASHSVGRPMTWELAMGLDQVRCDEHGAFAFEGLYPGEYRLHAFPTGDPSSSVTVAASAGTENLKINLSRTGVDSVTLKGQVTRADSGEPVTEFDLCPLVKGEASVARIKDDQGRYQVSGIAPGEVLVCARASGYSQTTSAPLSLDAGEHALDLVLYPARDLEISLSESSGDPIPSFRVSFLEQDVSWRVTHGWGAGMAFMSPKSSRLYRLPARQLTLLVSAEGVQRQIPIDLRPDRLHRVSAVLDMPALHPFQFQILEADAGFDDETWSKVTDSLLFDGDRSLFKAAMESGALRSPTESLSFSLHSMPGGVPAQFEGQSKPAGGMFEMTMRMARPDNSSSSEETLPVCFFTETLPEGAYTLTITSQVYQPLKQTYRLEENSQGQPALLLVRRKSTR